MITIVDEKGVVHTDESESKKPRYLTPKERAAHNTAEIQRIREDREVNSRPVHVGIHGRIIADAKLLKPLTRAEWQTVEEKFTLRKQIREIAHANAPTKVKADYIAQFKSMGQRIADGDKTVVSEYAMSKADFISTKNEMLRVAKSQIRKIDGELLTYWEKCVSAYQVSAAKLMTVREAEERKDCAAWGWPHTPSPILQALEKLARKPGSALNFSEATLLAFK